MAGDGMGPAERKRLKSRYEAPYALQHGPRAPRPAGRLPQRLRPGTPLPGSPPGQAGRTGAPSRPFALRGMGPVECLRAVLAQSARQARDRSRGIPGAGGDAPPHRIQVPQALPQQFQPDRFRVPGRSEGDPRPGSLRRGGRAGGRRHPVAGRGGALLRTAAGGDPPGRPGRDHPALPAGHGALVRERGRGGRDPVFAAPEVELPGHRTAGLGQRGHPLPRPRHRPGGPARLHRVLPRAQRVSRAVRGAHFLRRAGPLPARRTGGVGALYPPRRPGHQSLPRERRRLRSGQSLRSPPVACMAPRRNKWVGAWFDLARTTARASERMGKAALKRATKEAAKQAPPLQKTARWILSGVATPAAAPVARGGGRWEEGTWGLGPMAMRRYRLFVPPGAGTRRPVPLLVLLHGCGQDAASFAAATRAAACARAGGYAVLLPEQTSAANPQRCWNWFGPDAVVTTEAALIMAIVDHVCALHPLRRDSLFALGLSAGGAMALTLALHYPEHFLAVGTHSGAAPHSAATPAQAGQAMRGHRGPAVAGLRRRLDGRDLPPLLVIHGEQDRAVAIANADASVDLWLALAHGPPPTARAPRQTQRGSRHPYVTAEWLKGGSVYVRQVRIAGMGHAWSGGTARQAFSDPRGPDGLKLAWGFFARRLEI